MGRNGQMGTGLLLLGMIAAGEGAVRAQSQQADSGISFNLSTPGARSLAMGGAFLGLADDATAAYTNPAGLVNLVEGGTQVALEVRGWEYSNVFLAGGHLDGTAEGIGVDTESGPLNGVSEDSTNGLSFVSVGYVLPGGTALALYRHELANFLATSASQGPFQGNGFLLPVFDPEGYPVGEALLPNRFFPSQTATDLSIINYGLSAAYELELPAQHALALGVGISYYQFDLSSYKDTFNILPPFDPRDPLGRLLNSLPRGYFGPADFQSSNVIFTEARDGKDTDLGFSFGWLWKIAPRAAEAGESRQGSQKSRWSIGGVYRRGPEFRTQQSGTGIVFPAYRLAGSFKVPDVYGIGVAYSTPRGTTKVTFDYDRVLYSQRLEDEIPIDFPDPEGLRIQDADQIHAGVEHSFPVIGDQLVLTLRGGAWYEPNHDLEYVGSDQCACMFIGEPGEDDTHFSFGLGLVSGESFEVDAAADFSDRTNTVSISLVKFF